MGVLSERHQCPGRCGALVQDADAGHGERIPVEIGSDPHGEVVIEPTPAGLRARVLNRDETPARRATRLTRHRCGDKHPGRRQLKLPPVVRPPAPADDPADPRIPPAILAAFPDTVVIAQGPPSRDTGRTPWLGDLKRRGAMPDPAEWILQAKGRASWGRSARDRKPPG